jgi:hypothetical protein
MFGQVGRLNTYEGRCSECGSRVRPLEGVIDSSDPARAYRILCPEHAPPGALEPPTAAEVLRLESIHVEDTRYER